MKIIEKVLIFIQKHIYYIIGGVLLFSVFLGSYLILSLTTGGTSIQNDILGLYGTNESNINKFNVKKDYDLIYLTDIKFSQEPVLSSSILSTGSSFSSISSVSSSTDNQNLINSIDRVIKVIDEFNYENGNDKELKIKELN